MIIKRIKSPLKSMAVTPKRSGDMLPHVRVLCANGALNAFRTSKGKTIFSINYRIFV